jgi:hypothetical protein
MNMRVLRTVLLLGAVAAPAFTLAERTAMAGDIAAAEVLFNDGQKLFDAGKIHEACEKFQESYTQDPAIGTMINLARCHEKEGKTASAWAEYKTVETLASRANQPQRQQYAHDEAAKLEPTLHQLVLNVKFPVEGMEITRNTTVIGKALWGEKIPVDPGDVILKATAPHKKPWTQTVHLAAGPGVDHFDIPALEDGPPETTPGDKETVIVTSNGFSTGKIIGLALAGAGVVAAGVGVAFQLVALSEESTAKTFNGTAQEKTLVGPNNTKCTDVPPPASLCPVASKSYNSHHDAAKSDQTIAIPLIAGGAGLLIAGAVVFFTAKPAETTKKVEKGATFTIAPTFSPNQSGLAVLGTF